MKSTPALLAVALAVGALAGAALGYWEARPWTVRFATSSPSAAGSNAIGAAADDHAGHDHPHADEKQAASDADLVQGPKAVIPEETYRFGNMEMNTKKNHVFPIKNGGDKPLVVTFLTHTCKCTKVMLGGKEVDVNDAVTVPPGGETKVELEWAAKVAPGPFRHGATFSLNDPARSTAEITVEGEIVGTETVSPSQFAFGQLRAGDKGTAEVYILSFIDEDLEVSGAEVVEPALDERLDVRVEPATKNSLPDKKAVAGVKVIAEYDASGVIGPFAGSIRVHTNLGKAPELEIPAFGTVKGDVSLYGRGWNDAAGLMRMEPMTSAAGGKAKLNITIRGDEAATAKLSIKPDSIVPKELKVTLGERRDLSPRLAQQSIEFEISPGTWPMVLAGDNQGGEGEVTLLTGLESTPEMKLRVQLTVSP